MSLASIVALLQSALIILGLAQGPDVSQLQKDQANQVASQAIMQATQVLSKTATTGDVSVTGMSKYTDKDFGFSFWYPSSWKVTDMSQTGKGMFNGTTDMAGNLSKGRVVVSSESVQIVIDKFYSATRTFNVNPGACGSCGPVRYFFDADLHQWMQQYPMGANGAPDMPAAQMEASKIPQPADVSHNTMGGLHIFPTGQRENASIVPLSARNFLQITGVTYTEQCYSSCAGDGGTDVVGNAQYLTNTILATDPSVATPVSAEKQIATIKAEQQAYGAPVTSVPQSTGTKDYKGAWFKVTYPANFTAKKEAADEASFTSPDLAVQFYVFSPLWDGEPAWYMKPLAGESVESDTSTPSVTSFTNQYGTIYHKKVTRYVTFASKDGSYKRSLVSITAGNVSSPESEQYSENTHHVFGYRYKDEGAYKQYLDQYLAFKKSLTQYGD